MPAHIVFGPVSDKIPAKWVCFNVSNPSPNVSEKYAFLKIRHCYKHHVCRVNRLKMILEDRDGNVIDFFALGQVADDLKGCEQQDFLLCLDFEVEECPAHCSRPFQIIAEDTEEKKSLIWVSKPSQNSLAPTSPQDAENTDIVVQQPKPSPAGKKKHLSYNYSKLSEIKINSIVDVYAVVKFVKPVVKGKGSDYFCVVGLSDPSLFNKEEEKLVCVFFHRDPNSLPKVEEGDILRLHRLKIQTYQGGKQGYNGPGFQWLAFHGSLDTRTFSSSSYTFEEQDKDQVHHLLEWWSKLPGNDLQSPQLSRLVKNATPLDSVNKDYFDLVCQVVQTCVLEPDVCRLLRVWDGTKFIGPLKEVTEAELNQSLKEDKDLIKASAGFAVDIFLFDNHAKESAHVKPGDFTLLTNVHAAVVSGLVELTVHGGGKNYSRGVQVLPAENTETQNLKKKLEAFVAQILGDSNNCFTSDQQDPGSSTIRSDPNEKFPDSKVLSQGFVLRENNTEEDEDGMDFALSKSCADQPLKVSPKEEQQQIRGRKDVPSKNKSLRRRMLYNDDNILGNPVKAYHQNNKISTISTENHENSENIVSVADKADGEKLSESSEDSSQSIWLSIYNDSDNERTDVNCAPHSTLQRDHNKPESNQPFPANSEGVMRSLKCISAPRTDHNLSPEDELITHCKYNKAIEEDDQISSQDSFVTVPSPNLGGGVEFKVSTVGMSNITSSRLDTGNPTQTEKRSAQHLDGESNKRMKCSTSSKEVRSMTSEEEVREKYMEESEEPNISININQPEREENSANLEKEMLPHIFSQDHLEILESQMLCFDSNTFAQAAKTDSNHQGLDERTKLPVDKGNKLEKKNLRPRKRKADYEVSGGKDSQRSQQNSPNSDRENGINEETQPSSFSEIRDVNEKSAANQESQDFLRVDTGESQVSSSTDSIKSSSEPRCMLKTASVVLDHSRLRLSTIQEVLDHPPPHKFRIQARVERMEPRLSGPHDLVHFLCPQCKFFTRMAPRAEDSEMSNNESAMCPKCVQTPSTLRAVSVLVLQLSDKHNTISASVWDKNADQFFGGISPQQLLNDPNSFQQVQQQLADLCPLGSSVESRPVLECCVCSYYVDGHVKIQIFDTTLV